jgi:hypothetical protein
MIQAIFPKAALAAALASAMATPAQAGPGVPSPANSTVPCAISVVPAPATSPVGEFTVVIRDLANHPVPNGVVTIDFSACGAEVRLAAQQLPGTVVDCAARTLTRITDGQGRTSFRVIGGSTGAPWAVGNGCAAVRGPGNDGTSIVLLATIQVSVYDLDGSSGLTAADLSLFLGDFFNGPAPPSYAARSDHNFVDGACTTQAVTAADLSRWIDLYFSAGAYGVPLCPP